MTRVDPEATIDVLVTRRAAAALRDAIAIVRGPMTEKPAAVITRPELTSPAIGKEIAIPIAMASEIAIETGIEIVTAIATEIETLPGDSEIANAIGGEKKDGGRNVNAAGASTPHEYLSRPIMETTTMGQPRTSRVTATACTRARTTRDAERLMILSDRIFTGTAAADFFQSSEAPARTVLPIATVLCADTKRAIKTGRATSLATGFVASGLTGRGRVKVQCSLA